MNGCARGVQPSVRGWPRVQQSVIGNYAQQKKKEQLRSERTEKHSDLDIAQMQHTEGQTLAVKQLIAASKGQDSEIDRQDATENFSGSYDIDYL